MLLDNELFQWPQVVCVLLCAAMSVVLILHVCMCSPLHIVTHMLRICSNYAPYIGGHPLEPACCMDYSPFKHILLSMCDILQISKTSVSIIIE